MERMNCLKYACMAVVAAGLASCSHGSDGAEEPVTEARAIELTSSIAANTRGTDLERQSTQIVPGQRVGVTITGAREAHNNVAWTVGEGGKMTPATIAYYGKGEATIISYHPYNESYATTGTVAFSVNTDQSTDAGYLNSDFLWVKTTASESEQAVPLTYAHKLAKVNISLKSDDITDLSGATVYVCGTKTSVEFDLATGEMVESSQANEKEIKAGVTTADASAVVAILIPQKIVAGTPLVRVELGGKSYTYTVQDERDLQSLYFYNFTLNVKEKLVELTLESETITDWKNNADEDAEGDADED